MKYDEIETALTDRRAAAANLRAANLRLKELGVTDLPGDAPDSPTSSNGSPPAPVLPDVTREDAEAYDSAFYNPPAYVLRDARAEEIMHGLRAVRARWQERMGQS